MFTNCYGDTDIGALECEEIEGHIAPDSEVMIQYAEKMEEERRFNRPLLEPEAGSRNVTGQLHEQYTEEEEDDDEDLVPLEIPQDSKEHWDCESILSTYSNLYNRPKIISEPVVSECIA
jgi:protein LTV1